MGVDVSPALVSQARARYPHLQFVEADAHYFDAGEKFDFILCSDIVNDLWDVQQVFEVAARHSQASTRLILNCYSRLWEIPRHIAERFGLAKPLLPQNWLTVGDIANLLYLADLEMVRSWPEIMWPLRTPLIDTLCNRYLVKLWPFRHLGNHKLRGGAAAPSAAQGS